MENEGLNNKLNDYVSKDYLPMHMPGHKRNPSLIDPSLNADITEIDGFDNFHHTKGVISNIKTLAASVYDVREAFISVNGSTGLILSAILAAASVSPYRKAIVAANCHISVWRALELAHITPVIVNPETSEMPFYGPVNPDDIELLLKENQEYAFVILTSPTYEGILSDTDSIYSVTTKYNVPLIIDSAHGAHFGLSKFFPAKAAGDLIITSIHKTLNAPTGTAVMLVNKYLASPYILSHYISLTTTTSPSYILMSGIDKCIRTLSETPELLDSWGSNVNKTRVGLIAMLKKLSLYNPKNYSYDPSKIIIMTNGFMSGYDLAKLLREEYKIEVEASFPDYIIAMTGIGDTLMSLVRFSEAILKIDESLSGYKLEAYSKIYSPYKPELVMAFEEAIKGRSRIFPVDIAAGNISAEYIFAYPPGVPLIFPGEKITTEKISALTKLHEEGATIVIDPMRKYSGEIRVKVDI